MKTIEETHPSFKAYNLYEIEKNVNCDGFSYLLELTQKHTIDKAVLRKVLITESGGSADADKLIDYLIKSLELEK